MNGARMFGSTISTTASVSLGEVQNIKQKILCSDDVVRSYFWSEINGIRRIVRQEWTSALVSAELELNLKITRLFTYMPTYPFDLSECSDYVQVV